MGNTHIEQNLQNPPEGPTVHVVLHEGHLLAEQHVERLLELVRIGDLPSEHGRPAHDVLTADASTEKHTDQS